jgi:hypothetical protein
MNGTKGNPMTICRSLWLWSLLATLNVIQVVRPWLML